MRIDHCPECGKAGLKYDDPSGKDGNGLTSADRSRMFQEASAKNDLKTYFETTCGLYGKKKWCPRCKEWVEPTNIPYIGVKG